MLLPAVELHHLLPVIGHLVQAVVAAEIHQVEHVFLEAAPTKTRAGLQKLRSNPAVGTDCRATSRPSAPVALQRASMLLIELMRWARKALAVSLLSSLLQRLVPRMRLMQFLTTAPSLRAPTADWGNSARNINGVVSAEWAGAAPRLMAPMVSSRPAARGAFGCKPTLGSRHLDACGGGLDQGAPSLIAPHLLGLSQYDAHPAGSHGPDCGRALGGQSKPQAQ